MLSYNGHAVSTAINGKDGLEAMLSGLTGEGTQFDIVLMDIQMPVMGGLDAVYEYRAVELKFIPDRDNRKLFICGMSADCGEDVSASAMKSGMNYFFTKPIKNFQDIYERYTHHISE